MILVLFVIVNIVVSFAYLRGKVNNNESVSTIAIEGAGNINVVYSSNTADIVVGDILPGYETIKQFSVTSNISSGGTLYKRGIWYQIKLIVETNEFLSGSLVYSLSLDNTSSTDGITALPVDKIAIPNGSNLDGIVVGTGYFLNDNITHTYNLKLSYVNLEDVDQSSNYQKRFAARVVIDNPKYINLTFDLDGGSFENLKLNSNSTMKVAANSTIDLPVPIKESNVFAGWEDINDKNIFSNVITTSNADISLKALYTTSDPYEFDYTGGEQQFIAQYSGYYKIETWGAQGGSYDETFQGGYGGYSIGIIKLNKNEKIYVNIGGGGSGGLEQTLGGYNGGGDATGGVCNNNSYRYSYSGGGATSLALVSGELENLELYKGDFYSNGLTSNSSIILIVAGGGGGAFYFYDGAYGSGASAGGYVGNTATWTNNTHEKYHQPTGGTQTSGGIGGNSYIDPLAPSGFFGNGGNMNSYTCAEGSGGGGGYYGGGSGAFTPGAGGSGYIGNSQLTDKYMYCYNCETSDEIDIKTYTTTCANETPTENCAKKGNGYARITYFHV